MKNAGALQHFFVLLPLKRLSKFVTCTLCLHKVNTERENNLQNQ